MRSLSHFLSITISVIDSTNITIMETHSLTVESTRAYKLMSDQEFTTQLISPALVLTRYKSGSQITRTN